MSLAYKLWRIGKVLREEDIKEAIIDSPSNESPEPNYVNINFKIKSSEIVSIELLEKNISKDKILFSSKIGGSGAGMYYLYPNLRVLNEKLDEKKLTQLKNTLEHSILKYANSNNQKKAALVYSVVSDQFEKAEDQLKKEKEKKSKLDKDKKKNSEKIKQIQGEIKKIQAQIEEIKNSKTEFMKIKKKINMPKGNYWIWLSINGKTFNELMPEIWNNWYQIPSTKNNEARIGYDIFSNQETEVGFRPDIKVFSYDNYDDRYNERINFNLPLSSESAKYIKFAWLYITKNLIFNYRNMEYLTLPNILLDNESKLTEILYAFKNANEKTASRKSILQKLAKEEKDLDKEIKGLKKKKEKFAEEEERIGEIQKEINELNPGLIHELDSELEELGQLRNSLTVDYMFLDYNRTNGSFEIKGSIEDVIPSQVSRLVDLMRINKISDQVAVKKYDREKTYLRDFFHRDELYFYDHQSSNNNKNSILKERFYLARLLLSDEMISLDEMMERFHYNREYDYSGKKRIKNGIKEWINYPESFAEKEINVMSFFQKLSKIKE